MAFACTLSHDYSVDSIIIDLKPICQSQSVDRDEKCHLCKTPISRLLFGEGKPEWFELQFLTKEGEECVCYHIFKR